jgi:hypothetical protein
MGIELHVPPKCMHNGYEADFIAFLLGAWLPLPVLSPFSPIPPLDYLRHPVTHGIQQFAVPVHLASQFLWNRKDRVPVTHIHDGVNLLLHPLIDIPLPAPRAEATLSRKPNNPLWVLIARHTAVLCITVLRVATPEHLLHGL